MFCPSCGIQLADPDKFCRQCGYALSAPVQPSPQPPVVQIRNVYAGKRLQIFGALVISLGLIIMMGSCIVASGQSSDNGLVEFSGFISLVLFLAGLILLAVGKFSHWYHAE